jgi:hypothetical protein
MQIVACQLPLHYVHVHIFADDKRWSNVIISLYFLSRYAGLYSKDVFLSILERQ